MAVTDDWLALPSDVPAVPTSEIALTQVDCERLALEVPQVSERSLAVAKERSEERTAYLRAWDALTTRQQVFLRALKETGFNTKRAVSVFNEATKLDPTIIGQSRAKHRLSAAATRNWAASNANYKIVLAAMKAEMVTQVASRDDLLLRSHRAAEYAEEEAPILHQGEDTGYRERKVGEMIRANEQLMKATKVLGGEERGGTGVGPALIIQVVQRDGGLIDVTPRDVTIDLPAPAAPHGT